MIITYIINKHLPSGFLEPLSGRTIAISCSDFNKTWYCMFEDRFSIIDSIPEHIDVTISSSVAGFLQYAIHNDRSALNIAGNIAVAEVIQKLLSDLNIDWEEELSHYTGDVVAHQAMRFMHQLRNTAIDEMVAEYLQEEAKILPNKHEMQEFLHAVDELRTDVDRLAARIEHAINN